MKKIRTKLLLSFLVMTIPAVIMGLAFFVEINVIAPSLTRDIPENIEELSKNSHLDSIAQFIRYYDEVLTQSARNYAFTGDEKWKKTYEEVAPKLDENIKEAMILGDETEKKFFSDVDAANVALVEMEGGAISLVGEDKKDEAVGILESDEYWKQKEIYKNGLVKYVEKRGYQYDQSLSSSTKVLEASTGKFGDFLKRGQIYVIIFLASVFLLAVFLTILATYIIVRPIEALKKASEKISSGNFDQKIETKSKDEIGSLAESFNKMVVEIKESKANIEKRVAERTVELEKLNKFMVGRELKMKELKEEIEKLENSKEKS